MNDGFLRTSYFVYYKVCLGFPENQDGAFGVQLVRILNKSLKLIANYICLTIYSKNIINIALRKDEIHPKI